MDVAELARREPLEHVLRGTMAVLWSWVDGRCVTVLASGERGEDRAWWGHRFLSVYCVTDAVARVRRFAADLFRHTNVPWRVGLQWSAGTLFAARVSPVLGWRRAFVADPVPERATQQLVVPGNRSIRLFDFERGTSTVAVKQGFERSEFENEIAGRRSLPADTAPEVLEVDAKAGVLVERLVPGRTLARCPVWSNRTRFERRAFELVRDWQDGSWADLRVEEYLQRLRSSATAVSAQYERLYGTATTNRFRATRHRLESLAATARKVMTARTHGDFQAGNILVSPEGRVFLIDFERWAVRASDYDWLVYGLRSRSPAGRHLRFRRFLHTGATVLAEPTRYPGLRRLQRVALLARFLLEDIEWYTRDALGGPFHHEPPGLGLLFDDVARIADLLQ